MMWWATEVMVMKGHVWYPQNTWMLRRKVARWENYWHGLGVVVRGCHGKLRAG